MAKVGTASLTIAEMREFAGFTAEERACIEETLEAALAPKTMAKGRSLPSDRRDLADLELEQLRASIPSAALPDSVELFMGALIRVTARDLADEQLSSFSAYRFLYERLLGAKARPWLPAAFCGAAALPQIRPTRRKQLLQSLSEAAATAPAWSEREPSFYPETLRAEAA